MMEDKFERENSIVKRFAEVKQILPEDVDLVVVSKNHTVDKIQLLYGSGQRVFGENRVQELLEKQQCLPKNIQWHMIGHLQTNKVKYIAPFVSLIQSVDSYKLLKEIHKQAVKNKRRIDCLLQVRIAEEQTKFGLEEEEIITIMQNFSSDNVRIVGFMGMATNTKNIVQVRKEFEYLNQLLLRLKHHHHHTLKRLSMGMSNDYKIAIECGSTMVRIGSSIFGQRVYE